MKAFVALAVVALAGCASPRLLAPVSVPVPVPCDAVVPERPALPTEALPHNATLDAFVAAAAAEIELREGYEKELRAALGACLGGIKPHTAPTPAPVKKTT